MRQLLQEAEGIVGQGLSLIIFPEGTRVAAGETAEIQPGVTALYRRLGVPVVPVVMAIEWFARIATAHCPDLRLAGCRDVEVVRGRLEVAEGRREIRESDLDGHLGSQSDMPPERAAMSQRLREDYQLSEALNLLKALNVVDRRRG